VYYTFSKNVTTANMTGHRSGFPSFIAGVKGAMYVPYRVIKLLADAKTQKKEAKV
jgi:hypothetical protein